jgi:predicted ester cyclase
VFGEGDRVFTRVRLTGTNTGEFMGKPATGKRVDIRWVMNVVRVQDGKVVEEWELFDNLDLMKQLGHISDT